MTIIYSPAHVATLEQLTDAFNRGYEGYLVPVNLQPEQLAGHVAQNDLDLAQSVVAWEGDGTVGVGMFGVRGKLGWIGGIGVAVSHRQHGIGRGMMHYLIGNAHNLKLETVMLEVISGNDRAKALYDSLGFETLRRLLILEYTPNTAPNFIPDPLMTIQQMNLKEALSYYAPFHPIRNPWQRTRESLSRLAAEIPAWLAYYDGKPVAYVIANVGGKGIQMIDLAFSPGYAEIMRGLVIDLHSQQPDAPVRITNLGEDDPAWPILAELGYCETLSQVEMLLPIML